MLKQLLINSSSTSRKSSLSILHLSKSQPFIFNSVRNFAKKRKMLEEQSTENEEFIPMIKCEGIHDVPDVIPERIVHRYEIHHTIEENHTPTSLNFVNNNRDERVENSIQVVEHSDPYFWFREKEKVMDYIKSENTYQKTKMKPLKKLQDKIFNEIKNKIQQNNASVPYIWKDYYYYSRVGSNH